MSRINTAVELFVDSMNDRHLFISKAATKGFTPNAAATYWQVLKRSTSPRIKYLVMQAKRKVLKTFLA